MLDFLPALWLPIILSAAAVWIASALCWMALPHHKKDHIALPNEDAFSASLRAMNIPPGNYIFPNCSGRSHKDPAFQERWKQGPNGLLGIWREVNMGRNMILTFLVYLVISIFIAYLGWVVLVPGADASQVFQALGTAGVLAYCFSHIPNAIWFNAYPRAILMNILDGIAFGLITGGIFTWLWPAA